MPSPSESQRTAGGIRAFGDHGDAVRHDERRIEADAELPDQLGILGRVAAQTLEKFLRAGARDGAEILDDFVPGHADAVVLDGQGARRGIRNQRDRERIRTQQGRIGESLEAQLLARIGGVGDQFAQENFLVRIQRMDHQSQHLLGFGLKLFYLWLGFGDHDLTLRLLVDCWRRSSHRPVELGPPPDTSSYGHPARGSNLSSRFMRS